MPRVKVDYVVSFSSEDPEHPASNLVSGEVSKRRWLCSRGQPACSVVLQLARAVQILSVNIGAYNTAFVEVLVGRSEGTNEQFEVLVARSVVQSPAEARRGAAGDLERVRAFSGPRLAQPAASQRWDRLRVVCTQPYNKHCQYGLSFVHVHEAGSPSPSPAAAPALALDTYPSSEDEFRPGELFAKHRLAISEGEAPSATNTETQIRQATSQALKNISESSTKLKKTLIAKAEYKQGKSGARPHEGDQFRAGSPCSGDVARDPRGRHCDHRQQHITTDNRRHSKREAKDETMRTEKRRSTGRDERDGKRQRPAEGGDTAAAGGEDEEEAPGPVWSERRRVLAGAVFSLSGYRHPRRAALRDLGLALGARYQPDAAGCTHLICAFPGTPKLRATRAAGGAACARGEWLEQMAARRRRLPWRWFATEPAQRRPPPPRYRHYTTTTPTPTPTPTPDDCDTDDEIEQVLREQKDRGPDSSSRQTASDVMDTTLTAEQSSDNESDVTVEWDNPGDSSPGGSERDGETAGRGLPAFFEGCTFVVGRDVTSALLRRYLRAYGGLVLEEEQAARSQAVAEYYVGGGGGVGGVSGTRGVGGARGVGGRRVSPGWVWRCHARARRLPPDA